MKNLDKLLAVALLAGFAAPGFPATNELVNFGKVNDSLYRGAQPGTEGLQRLQALGIKSVINLRMTNDVWWTEPAVAKACSIAYTNLPLHSLSAPTDAQVTAVLAAIEKMPKPVFVHCQHGCDRTGTIIACYRIRHDHWTNAQALKEADAFGLSPFEAGMRRYIARFKP